MVKNWVLIVTIQDYYNENNSRGRNSGEFQFLYTTIFPLYNYHVSLNNYVEDNPFAEPSPYSIQYWGRFRLFRFVFSEKVEF